MRRLGVLLLVCACAQAGSEYEAELPALDVDAAAEAEQEDEDMGFDPERVLLPVGTELFREATGSEQIGIHAPVPAGPPGAPPPVVAYRVLGRKGTRLHVQTVERSRYACTPLLDSNPLYELDFWVEASAAQHVLTNDVEIVLPDGRAAILAMGTAVQPGRADEFVVDAAGAIYRVALPRQTIGRTYDEEAAVRPRTEEVAPGATRCLIPRANKPPSFGAPRAVEVPSVNLPVPGRTIFHDNVFGCTTQALLGPAAPRRVWSGTDVFWRDGGTIGSIRGMHTFRVSPRTDPSGLLCFDEEITPGVEASLCFNRYHTEFAEVAEDVGSFRVELGARTTTGKQQRVIRSHLPDLRRCWRSSRRLGYQATGSIDIEFGVAPDGHVAFTRAAPNELENGCAVMACFRDVFAGMTFPRSNESWTGTHVFQLMD